MEQQITLEKARDGVSARSQTCQHARERLRTRTMHTQCRLCEQYTSPRTCHTRNHFLACESRLKRSSRFAARIVLCSFTKTVITSAQCTWLNRILLPHPHGTPSSLYPSPGTTHCDPQHGVEFGPSCRTEPHNDPVEVTSTEVTTMLLPSKRASIESTYNLCIIGSGSKTKNRNVGFTAVHTEERSKCSPINDLSL